LIPNTKTSREQETLRHERQSGGENETEETDKDFKETGEEKGTDEMRWTRKVNKYRCYLVYLKTFSISRFTLFQMTG
jgi:hypothetical protein